MAKNSQLKKSIVLIAGIGLLLPIAGLTASASSADGRFLMKATNEADASIFSVHGYSSTEDSGSGTPTEPEIPGDGEETEQPPAANIFFELECGPVDLSVTDKLVESASEIWAWSPSGGAVTSISADSPKPEELELKFSDGTMIYFLEDNGCSIEDTHTSFKENLSYAYTDRSGVQSETRFMTVEGKRTSATVNARNGAVSAISFTDVSTGKDLESSTIPYSYMLNSTYEQIAYKLGGGSDLKISLDVDRTGGSIRYTPSGSSNPQPFTGPERFEWTAYGKISRIYINEVGYSYNGNWEYLNNESAVDWYNRTTGGNWDGKWQDKITEDHRSVPFAPHWAK